MCLGPSDGHVYQVNLSVSRPILPQERVQRYTMEQSVDVPDPQIQEETVEMIQLILQDRISDRIVEQTVDVVNVDPQERERLHTGRQVIDMPVVVQQQAPVDNANVSMSAFGQLNKNRLATKDEPEAGHKEQQERQQHSSKQSTATRVVGERENGEKDEEEKEMKKKEVKGKGERPDGEEESDRRRVEEVEDKDVDEDAMGWVEVQRRTRRRVAERERKEKTRGEARDAPDLRQDIN